MTITKALKNDVRAPYTFEAVRASLLAQHDVLDAKGKKTSWRKIAKNYGVTHAAVHRAAVYGIEPKDFKIRHALGLSHTIRADIPVCQVCDKPYEPRHKCEAAPTKYAPHPVMRRTVVDRGVFAALGALYQQRGSGDARYRLALRRTMDGMTG